MKTFGAFMLVLLIILILLGVYIVHEYVSEMSPVWKDTAAQTAAIKLSVAKQTASTDVQAYQERATVVTDVIGGIGYGAVFLLLAFGGVHAWKVYDQRRESWARAVDGTFALQRMNKAGQAFIVDPNKAVFGVFGQNASTGALITDADMVGPDRQLAYAFSVQKTRTTSAMLTSGTGPKYAAHAKLLAGAYDKNGDMPKIAVMDEDEGETAYTGKALTVHDAFAQSDSNRWILGQSPATGELFELNPKEAAHFGVVGATGAGKTVYTALMLMAYAMRNKYRISVLDGKGGADWSKYKDVIEYSSLDYTNVGGIISQITGEYEKRQAILNQYGVNSIWELPKGMTVPRPTLFIVDEFGAVMDSLKAASRNAYKAVELDLGNLLRLSRGAGLYVVLCDQNPSKWPGTIRANMPMNICYRLGGNIGNAVNEYSLDKLNRVGQFQVSNTIYNAFPTYQVIDDLLSTVDYRKPKALLTIDGAVTGYGKEGRDTGENPTPQSVTVEPVIAPVTGGYTRVTAAVTDASAPVTTPVTPVMEGKPVTGADQAKVRNIYAITQSKSETCRLVWGGKNGQRMAWLNEVLASEVQQ